MMASDVHPTAVIPEEYLEAIRAFPLQRLVTHCGVEFAVSPFDLYATCRQCEMRIKVRSFTAEAGVEDLFDAFFEWMNQPGAQDLAKRRQQEIRDDDEPTEQSKDGNGDPPTSPFWKPSRSIELD